MNKTIKLLLIATIALLAMIMANVEKTEASMIVCETDWCTDEGKENCVCCVQLNELDREYDECAPCGATQCPDEIIIG